jgi:hypothetical protein
VSNDSSTPQKTGNAFLDGLLNPAEREAQRQREADAVATAHRITVLAGWREHPDVLAFVAADRAWDFASWEEFRAADDPWWGIDDELARLSLACIQQIGTQDMAEADREIVTERYRCGARALIDPLERKWVLLRDNATTCPVDFVPDEADQLPPSALAWAIEYRAGLHADLRERGMRVGMTPGRPPVLAVWIGVAQPSHILRAWVEGIAARRFDVVRKPAIARDFERKTEAYEVANWTTIEPVRVVTAARQAAFKIHTTGIAPLDALLATEGIPRGARVYVQAATGHGKSVFDLQIGEHFADHGFRVALIATSDESAESITARRLQRIMKLDRKTALEFAMGDDAASIAARAKLNPNLTIVDGATTYLEDVIASEPALIICDPIQKIRTRAGGGDTYTLDSTAAAVRVAEQSGITFVCASSKVKRAGRDLEASFGGASIPNGATLQIDLERRGTTVNGRVLKSRYGGEGESFDLELDADRQALGTVAPPVSEVEIDRRARILDVLAKGPKTANALRTWVAGKQPELKASLDALVTAGKVVLNGKEYALKDPA